MAELDTNAGESSSICTSNTEADISCHSSQSRTVSHESHMMTSTAQPEPMGGNTHQDLIEGDKEEVPYHPISRLSQIILQNPKKMKLSHEGDMMTTTTQPEPMAGNTHQDLIKGDEKVVPYHPISRLSQIVPQNPEKNELTPEGDTMTTTTQPEPMAGNAHQDLIKGDAKVVPYYSINWFSPIIPQNPKTNELSHEDDMTTTSQPDPMGGNTYQDHIKGDDEVVPYHPNRRLSQIVAQNPKKNEYRALQRLVHQRRMTKGMMRRAFTLYNLEIGISSLTPEVLSSLEQLFELQDIQWPTKLDRLLIIAEKFHYALRSLLRQYG